MMRSDFFHPFLSVLFLIFMIHSAGFSQASLNLENPNDEIKNVIEFFITPEELITLKKARGEKIEFKQARVKTDDGKKLVEKLKIRGQSSLSFDRKSFNVNLFFTHNFSWGNEKKELKEFYLISLAMDQNYYRSALSYRLLAELGLFTPFIAFAEVKINRESQGIYLVVEKPHENKMKVHDSPFMLRRGYQHKVNDTKFEKKNTQWKKKDYLEVYEQLYQVGKNSSGRGAFSGVE